MRVGKAHILHPAWFPAVWAQDRAQVGSFGVGRGSLNLAWENKM